MIDSEVVLRRERFNDAQPNSVNSQEQTASACQLSGRAHTRCWMLWPQRPDTWRNGGKPAQRAFVEAARLISRFEPVTMGVNQ